MATLTISDMQFHRKPTLNVKTSLSVIRSSPSSSTVNVSGRIYFRTGYYAASPNYYGTPPYTGSNRGLSAVIRTPQANSGNIGSFYGLNQRNGDYNYKEANSIYIDTNVEFTSGSLTLYIDCKWLSNGKCDQGYSDVAVGSIDISQVPYNPDTPPTNITGGRVYNQNGVVNGDDKLDWDFYVDWWGESAGTHTINYYNLDIYNAADLNSRVAVVIDVKKFTKYNFESLLPKCKVGETYAFYVNALIDNSYWLGKVYIGSIKLYKDGIVWVKNYSNGSKVEATMAYNKYYTDGSKKKSRYILVKDINGAKRIIDMYTTHYE